MQKLGVGALILYNNIILLQLKNKINSNFYLYIFYINLIY